MAISLTKGQNLRLDARATQLSIRLTWNPRVGVGEAFDLDAVCFLLDANEKTRGDDDFIFYHQLESPCGSVKHLGDDLVGGSGERVDVDLSKTPNDVQKIVFAVAIYDAEQRRQNFGMVRDASISLVDRLSDAEIARFDLSEDAGVESVLVFGELYRYQGDWKFRALGESFAGGLEALVRHYGLEIA